MIGFYSFPTVLKTVAIYKVCFEVFPEGCDRRAISYLEGSRVSRSRDIVTERIIKCMIYELFGQKWG